jgi:uncharacterized protein (TIGR02996 family)
MAPRLELMRLVEACKADPLDDAGRLILADWLEEHGDETDRALERIIRLQMSAEAGGPDYWLTIRQIARQHLRQWLGPSHGFFRRRMPRFERGLLHADVPAGRWVESPDDDGGFEWVESASFDRVTAAQGPVLLASAKIAGVSRLEVRSPLTPDAQDALARSRHLKGKRGLTLSARESGLASVGRLLRCEGIHTLAELRLKLSPLDGIGDEGMIELAGIRGLAGLQAVEVFDAHLGERGAAALFAAFPRLRRLSVGRSSLGSSIGGLASAAFRDTLESLFLDVCALEAEGVAAFAGMRPPPRLRRLGLSWCGLRPPLAGAFFSAPTLHSLDGLELLNTGLGPAGAAALASSGWAGPRVLHLWGNGLGDRGAAHVAAWPGLSRVRHLGLYMEGIGNKGLRALAASPHITGLESLDLLDNEFGRPGLRALAASPVMAVLRWLSLEYTPAAEFAEDITSAPALRELRLGEVAMQRMGEKALARLRERLPDCAIG